MPVAHLILLLVAHYVADFLFQTREVADNKSKDNKILAYHAFIYTIVISVFVAFIIPSFATFVAWGVITFFTHLVTDGITSKFTSKFFREGRVSQAFKTIGLDQLIHYCTLIFTYLILF